ncbi:CotY/CotZ family spore coat protein [Cytobacillus firmus]|uniref:CotY/CotZ family spore coat protein n=1 Tax=Cytobacillus firmus TaxID=1399 RepID=UPI001CFF0BA7|nr:CotY/CotZ family spore coat protein [Cytobacillus firmus]WHY64151.1 CotY/CotZ family spore coat protein [Cytobacillus firmus]
MFKYSHHDHKDESSCCHDEDKHRDWKDDESSDDCHDKDKDKKDHDKHPRHHKVCVREVLAAILNAQKKAKRDDECKTSCNESIKELLGDSKKPKKNAIPFILYNEEAEPFKASGVTIFSHSKQKKFACIESFIFKIKDLDGKCAVLELLTFKHGKCSKDLFKKSICSPCSQIDCEDVSDLMGTGICITVDLSCFCGVTCLPAVRL